MICCLIYLAIFAAFLYGFTRLDSNPLLAFYERFFPNKEKLRGKKVWVVGASTGIGEELAYQLAELNCKLILTSTTESKLQEVKENCLKRSKNNLKSDDILVLAYDISDFKRNDDAFKQIIDKFGDIDMLVSNAARIHGSKIADDDFEQHKKIFDVNFFSHLFISKLVVRNWLQNKTSDQKLEKYILVTSSIASYVQFPFTSSYSGSKKALDGYFRDLSMQHQKDGIAVSICLPGPVKSNLTKNRLPSKYQTNMDNLKRMETSRCSSLMLVSMANKLHESWITFGGYLLVTYLYEVFSYQMCWLIRNLGLVRIIEKNIFKE